MHAMSAGDADGRLTKKIQRTRGRREQAPEDGPTPGQHGGMPIRAIMRPCGAGRPPRHHRLGHRKDEGAAEALEHAEEDEAVDVPGQPQAIETGEDDDGGKKQTFGPKRSVAQP